MHPLSNMSKDDDPKIKAVVYADIKHSGTSDIIRMTKHMAKYDLKNDKTYKVVIMECD